MEGMDLNNITVYFDWVFSLRILNKNGLRRQNHLVGVMGYNYSSAKGQIEYTARKRRWIIEKINSAKIKSIAYAFYNVEGHPWVPWDLYKDIPRPEIPTELQ